MKIYKGSQRFTGLNFALGGQFVYTHDTKLPFGSRLPPDIFHRLTHGVKRMVVRRGFAAVVVYLVDVFI